MGKAEFTVALAVGAFLLASWVDARIGDSRPESPIRRSVHVLLGLVVLKLAVVLVGVRPRFRRSEGKRPDRRDGVLSSRSRLHVPHGTVDDADAR